MNLFDTQEKIDAGIAGFKNLLADPGWKLVEDILDVNIEIAKQQLENGIEGETPEVINRVRDRLRIYREVKATPHTMIERLSSAEGLEPDFDPYDTEEQIKARKLKEQESDS